MTDYLRDAGIWRDCTGVEDVLYCDVDSSPLAFVRAHRHSDGTVHIIETGETDMTVTPDGSISLEPAHATWGSASISSSGRLTVGDGSVGAGSISVPAQSTVTQPVGFHGVTIWDGGTPLTYPDGTTTADLPPIIRAVSVARLRALADVLEQG